MEKYIKFTKEKLMEVPHNTLVNFFLETDESKMIGIQVRNNGLIFGMFPEKDHFDGGEIPSYGVRHVSESELDDILKNYKSDYEYINRYKNEFSYTPPTEEQFDEYIESLNNYQSKFNLQYEDSSSKEGYYYNGLLKLLYKLAEDSNLEFFVQDDVNNPFNIADVKDMFMENHHLTKAVIRMMYFASMCGERKLAKVIEDNFDKFQIIEENPDKFESHLV